jgi:hypothetical protein
MFQSLFRRAEVALEHTVGHVATRVFIAVPFLVAAGFGTAALSVRLRREFDVETSYLILAGLYVLVGFALAIILALRPSRGEPASTAADAEAKAPQPAADTIAAFSDTDRELLIAALTSAAPIALPHVARMVVRNLPILAAVGAAIFVMTRSESQSGSMAAAE